MSKVIEGENAAPAPSATPDQEPAQPSFAERSAKWTDEQRQTWQLTGNEPEISSPEPKKEIPAATPEREAPKPAPDGTGKEKQEPTKAEKNQSWRKDRKIGELSAELRRTQRELEELRKGKSSSNAPAAPVEPSSDRPKRPKAPRISDPQYDNPEKYDAAYEQYETDLEKWTLDVAAWDRKQALAEAETAKQREKTEQDSQAAEEAFDEREETFLAEDGHEDYPAAFDAVIAAKPHPMAARALMELEDGPAVIFYLGQNPAELKRVFSLGPMAQIAEFGRISVALKKAPKPNTVSKAPNPPASLGGKEETVQGPKPGSKAWMDAENERDLRRMGLLR